MAKNPYDDDDDDDKTADKAAVESMREKISTAAEPPPKNESGDPEIDVDRAEEELETSPAGLSPEQRESRNERRRNRYREQIDRATRAEEERDRLRAEAAQTREMLVNMQRSMLQQQTPQQSPKTDPL